MTALSRSDRQALLLAFRESLEDCARLYAEIAEQSPAGDATADRQELRELHCGAVLKLYAEIAGADQEFTADERDLALEILQHAWGRSIARDDLPRAVRQLSEQTRTLHWNTLLGPFRRAGVLRGQGMAIESALLRLGNIVAKFDGEASPEELQRLSAIQGEIRAALQRAEPPPADHSPYQERVGEATKRGPLGAPAAPPPPPLLNADERARLWQQALDELEELIGLSAVKQDVRELANFLRVQQQRAQVGLPATPVSLHLIFCGNPGTGKTTVARLLAKLYQGLGVLARGHLVETDRSGLVAGYAGQTATKTQQLLDSAQGGLLFIDEAYSLVATESEDPYGREALQVLLKRMEDDRQAFALVLAGYTQPMEELLEVNPGLASRFSRTIEFPDYSSLELAQIMDVLCKKHHYDLPSAARLRLITGLEQLVQQRDEKFGNGRLVRNLFEAAIRRLANRVVKVPQVTRELLTRIEPEDWDLPALSQEQQAALADPKLRLSAECPACHRRANVPVAGLGREVVCPQCDHKFLLDWALPNLDGHCA